MKDYPIGTHFIHEGKEFVVEKSSYSCKACYFYTDKSEQCGKLACYHDVRADKTNVIFTYLSTVKDLK